MARNKRNWHPNFLEYMEMIVNHPNYEGLSIKRTEGELRWIAPAESDIGKKRIEWAEKKAIELGLPLRAGVYAEVMLAIHPTKKKVCQTCGNSMSLYYHYPNNYFLKAINKKFNSGFTDCDHISDIWDELINQGVSKSELSEFFVNKGGLDHQYRFAEKNEIIASLELACRKGGKKYLGPGAMSNFPDRFDGFHTYNRCCRSTQDKGRAKENLKAYTKDRRAYEYWSDGNIQAANQFMGSSFFDGISADHIGPISLGFVHDPRYLQPMASGENSSKRDRLLIEDIESIINIENRTGVYPMSWQSKLIWEYIRNNYKKNPNKVSTVYRDALKQNMSNFMYVLFYILEECSGQGEEFLIKAFLEPHYDCFKYSYKFNSKGEIIEKESRHFTERNKNEMDRYVRIAIDSVFEYSEKDNRNNKPDLNCSERKTLNDVCIKIKTESDIESGKKALIELVEKIEERIIATL